MSWTRIALAAALLVATSVHAGPRRNGFELSPADIPVDEILAGGPARDGIPALTDPDVLPATAADWPDDSIVMGVVRNGEARAYPVAILDWHELVNDSLGGEAILVTYCPLCGTGLVFDRKLDGASRTFGVSGLLYKSDVLFYDRETESLWSQIESRAVTGPERGKRLALLRSEQVQWGAWRAKHPRTTVLSRKTGHARDYGRSPYAGYSTSERLFFPASFDRRYMAKMPTVGVRVAGGTARAYPAVEIMRAGGRVEESFEGHRLQVAYDTETQVFDVEAPGEVEVIEGYWFAWSAFHPESTVYVAPSSQTRIKTKEERAR